MTDTKAKDTGEIARKNRRVAIVMMIWLGLLFGFVFAGPEIIVKEATVRGKVVAAQMEKDQTTGQEFAAIDVELPEGRKVRAGADRPGLPAVGAEIELQEKAVLGLWSTYRWVKQ